MNHAGHMAVGLIIGSVSAFALQVPLSLQLVGLILLASILPDIDLKQSKASKLVEFVAVIGGTIFLQPFFSSYSLVGSIVIALLTSAALVYLLLFPLRLKHRGVTHSFKAAALFGVVVALVSGGISTGIISFSSYASHILVDKL